jgi:thiamine transport system substrate-binding protein
MRDIIFRSRVPVFSREQTTLRRFIDYLLSKDAQEIIPLTNWMYPVRDDAGLPESYEYAPKADTVLNLDPKVIEENLEGWIDQWLEVMSR